MFSFWSSLNLRVTLQKYREYLRHWITNWGTILFFQIIYLYLYIWSSDTSVDFQWNTRRYVPEGSTLHEHRCENSREIHFELQFVYKFRRNLWITVYLFADHLPASSAEIKKDGAIPPLPHMSSWHSA
jgi:hypothetical protein